MSNKLKRNIYYKSRYNRNLAANPKVKLILKTRLKTHQDYTIINHHVFNHGIYRSYNKW